MTTEQISAAARKKNISQEIIESALVYIRKLLGPEPWSPQEVKSTLSIHWSSQFVAELITEITGVKEHGTKTIQG